METPRWSKIGVNVDMNNKKIIEQERSLQQHQEDFEHSIIEDHTLNHVQNLRMLEYELEVQENAYKNAAQKIEHSQQIFNDPQNPQQQRNFHQAIIAQEKENQNVYAEKYAQIRDQIQEEYVRNEQSGKHRKTIIDNPTSMN